MHESERSLLDQYQGTRKRLLGALGSNRGSDKRQCGRQSDFLAPRDDSEGVGPGSLRKGRQAGKYKDSSEILAFPRFRKDLGEPAGQPAGLFSLTSMGLRDMKRRKKEAGGQKR
jgi:hypothetical protein